MTSRTSPPKSEWSCATNMFWDIVRATRITTRGGARSRSSSARQRDCRLLTSLQEPATTLAANNPVGPSYRLPRPCRGGEPEVTARSQRITYPSAVVLAIVVNFNDDFYLDLDKDFTSSVPELKEALERIDSRGSTALYDAIIGSLDHLKKGRKDKKVLLVVTDGEDNASRNSLEKTVREIQKTDAVIYTIGLLGQENKRSAKVARKALKNIAEASGGLAFFPENVEDVHAICEQVAHDIRNQYTIAYYPTNTRRDGSSRALNVPIAVRGHGKLTARTRNGYYAPGGAASAGAGN